MSLSFFVSFFFARIFFSFFMYVKIPSRSTGRKKKENWESTEKHKMPIFYCFEVKRDVREKKEKEEKISQKIARLWWRGKLISSLNSWIVRDINLFCKFFFLFSFIKKIAFQMVNREKKEKKNPKTKKERQEKET